MRSLSELLDTVEKIDGSGFALQEGGARLEFSRQEYARRYARAAALMAENDLDALVLAQQTSIRYFTGLPTWVWVLPPVMPVILILTRDPAKATLVDSEFDRRGLEAATWLTELTLYGSAETAVDKAISALRSRALLRGKLGFELGDGQHPNLSPHDLQALVGAVDGDVIDAGPVLSAVRMLKSDEEIDRLREACRLSQIGFEAAFEAMRVGSTEAELTRVAAEAMLAQGARPGMEPFMLKFIAGPRRFPEHLLLSTASTIRQGEQLHADGGCAVDGYRCDFMRSAVIGRLPDAAEHDYDVAVKGLGSGVSALRPGRPLGDVWQAAAATFEAAGYRTGGALTWGHGIGLEHWELPQISAPGTPAGDLTARPGMVLCIEPSAGSEVKGAEPPTGVFIVEDQVAVTNDGIEVLTASLPRELYRVEAAKIGGLDD